MPKSQVKKSAPTNTTPEKPVVIRKIITTIEQDKHGVQKRTTTTYNAPKASAAQKPAVKKTTAKPAPKKAAPKGKK